MRIPGLGGDSIVLVGLSIFVCASVWTASIPALVGTVAVMVLRHVLVCFVAANVIIWTAFRPIRMLAHIVGMVIIVVIGIGSVGVVLMPLAVRLTHLVRLLMARALSLLACNRIRRRMATTILGFRWSETGLIGMSSLSIGKLRWKIGRTGCKGATGLLLHPSALLRGLGLLSVDALKTLIRVA